MIQTFPLIPNDAILRFLLDASINVGEEGETSVAAQLHETMVGALIKLLAVSFVRHVNLRELLSALSLHRNAIDVRLL